jgi:hypothetical protein
MTTKLSVTEWVHSIKSGEYMWDEDISSSFSPYLVRRNLICESTIMDINKVNVKGLDKKLVYDYLFQTTPRDMKTVHGRKSPNKLEKEYLQCVKDYYGFNDKKSRDALRVLTVEQLEQIKTSQFKGGRG